MRILFFGADYPPTGGGIATWVVEWIRHTAADKRVTAVCAVMFNNASPRVERTGKLELRTYRTVSFFAVGWTVLRTALSERRASVLHSLNFFPVGFWVVFLGWLLRKKTAVTFYGTDACDESGSALTKFLKRWTVRRATHVFTISEYTKQRAAATLALPRERIDIVYPGVPSVPGSGRGLSKEAARRLYGLPDEAFVIVSVARLVERKGTDLLVQALAHMRRTDAWLLVVGDGPMRDSIVACAAREGVAGRVVMAGRVADLGSCYRAADIGALASWQREREGDFEGLGLVLLEAQSFGLPIVGTKSGGIPETFADGTTGLLVPERDVAALAAATDRLATDRALYAQMSAATAAFLAERFDGARNIARYVDIIATK